LTVTDPIADMLTRIRNAVMVRHESVLVPSSRMKLAISKILKEEGFITDYEVVKDEPVIVGLERVSKPGLRVYIGKSEIPRVYGGLGIAILSTEKGLMIGKKAWRQGVGGELLCYVW